MLNARRLWMEPETKREGPEGCQDEGKVGHAHRRRVREKQVGLQPTTRGVDRHVEDNCIASSLQKSTGDRVLQATGRAAGGIED